MLRKELGSKGEQLAADFLIKQGYEIVARNFRYDRGEIDIVAKKGGLLSFCEVKTRKTNKFGAGEDAVNLRKQTQLRKVAEGFIAEQAAVRESFAEEYEFRFDVVVVEISQKQSRIRFIENAF
jgi:putative endonuclease